MDQRLLIEDTPHGLQVTYGGRRLYGSMPLEDAARRARSVQIPPNSLVLWTSPVLWHGWTELCGALGEESAVLAVEADPVLRDLAVRHRPGSPRVVAVTSESTTEILRALRSHGQHRFRRVIELSTTSSAIANRATYRSIREAIDREIRVFWQNRLTMSAMGRLWLRNLIRNLPALTTAEPLAPLGSTTVICGAGPSLSEAIPLLRARRAEIRVIAVDTALPILHDCGIVPDLTVGLEGQLVNVYDFLPVPVRDYRLVADLTSHPASVELHARTSFTLTEFAPLALLRRVARLPGVAMEVPPLGSVGVAAVHLASVLDAKPLLLSGLDFAVLPGSTHARGAPTYRWGYVHGDRLHRPRDPAVGRRLLKLEGASGRARTTLVLRGYAEDLRNVLGARSDVYSVSPIGLDVGARAVSPEEADTLISLASAKQASGRLAVAGRAVGADPADRSGTPGRARLADFVRGELSLLEEFERRIESLDTLPPEVDYLSCELHDLITRNSDRVELLPFDRGSRARARVAADYYRSRWEASLSVLGGR